VLISAAVQSSNPEVQAAQLRQIPVWKYSECLGQLMSEREGIAVAGTHGKTTTTAMVSLLLADAGLDPGYLIGGDFPILGASSRWGKGPCFVVEACEFDRSFLNLRPKISIVTNIEEEHLDYFGSLKEIQGAFAEFVSRLPEDGCLVVNRDDPNSNYLSEFCRSSVVSFSLRPRCADWWADRITTADGWTSFWLTGQHGESALVRLQVPGIHNVCNALAAAAVAHRLGVPLDSIANSLARFTGVRRRFDVLARGRVTVVDDYAHHPTEVLSVLRAARQGFPGSRVVGVFQPHQHARLKIFRRRFAEALSRFDLSLVTDVHRARDREEDILTVQSDSLVATIHQLHSGASTVYTPGFDDAVKVLDRNVRDNDVVVFMGAGSITELAKRYARRVTRARPTSRSA
jgi:UDP-N-acetylmuramate--alanine ligase